MCRSEHGVGAGTDLVCVEYFAGVRSITGAFKRCHDRSAPFDIGYTKEHDMCSDDGVRGIMPHTNQGRYWAPPQLSRPPEGNT